MDFTETTEQRMLRSSVAALASKYGHDYLWAKAKAGEKTTELWNEASEAGFLGVAVPEEYGGGGAGMVELAIVTEEIAAAGCPLLLIVVSPAIAASVIATSGTGEQRDLRAGGGYGPGPASTPAHAARCREARRWALAPARGRPRAPRGRNARSRR